MKKNILMVCYYYPPLADVGCKRSIAFSKYLKKYDWHPHVVSVKNPDRRYCSLGDDLPPQGVHTEYSRSIINLYGLLGKLNGLLSRILKFVGLGLKRNYFYDIFCIPDIFWGWIPLTAIKSLNLIKKYDIDVIYVSCSPFSSAVIGVILKKITRKPLVLDFRDPYALNNPFYAASPKFRRMIDRKIEHLCLKNADALILTSEELSRVYKQQYYSLKENIVTIHNGFDPESLVHDISKKYSKFTIVYTGNFYFGVPELDIYTHAFFKALSMLKEQGKVKSSNFQFLYYDDGSAEIEKLSIEYSVQDLVVSKPRIAHQEMLAVISQSHLELIRVIKPMISTKLFEGIALNVPLLATIPKGEVENIISKYSPSSYVVSENSYEEVASAIIDAMKKYRNNEITDNKTGEYMEKFSRENLSIKLIDILEEKMQLQ